MSSLIRAKQIDALQGETLVVAGNFTLTPSSSVMDVTDLFTGHLGSGSSHIAGVLTDNAIVALSAEDGRPFMEGNLQLYGRLNVLTSGVWTITFFDQLSGEEVLVSTPTTGRFIEITCVRTVQLKNVAPTSVASIVKTLALRPTSSYVGGGGTGGSGSDGVEGCVVKTKRVRPKFGQTEFKLDEVPYNPDALEFKVNGHDTSTRVQVAGTTVTYDPTDFELDDKDEITFVYCIAIDLK